MRGQPNPRPVTLTCEHTIWYRYPPSPGEEVTCIKCGGPSTVPALEEQHWTTYPNEWFKARKIGEKRAIGQCIECGIERVGELNKLRDWFARHMRYKCDPFPEFKLVELPRDSPPPF